MAAADSTESTSHASIDDSTAHEIVSEAADTGTGSEQLAHEPESADSATIAEAAQTAGGSIARNNPTVQRTRASLRRGNAVEETRTQISAAPEAVTPPALPTESAVAQQPPAIPPESLEARRQESAQQIARILSAMKADEAAAVLKHMTDEEVVNILRYFNTRKAAGVMAGLSETRAAAISRRLLLSCEGCGGPNG